MPELLNDNLQASTPEEIFATRKHRVLKKREKKLRLNLLGLRGGRPYIEERLTQFPAESSIDWSGSIGNVSKLRWGDVGTMPMEGRRTRAYLVNHCARVAEKIRQYVFQQLPVRKGVPEDLEADITRQGDGLNAFMGEVMRLLVACRWCWVGIDAPSIEGEVSRAQARAEKIRPYWLVYDPTQVVDWRFNAAGVLEWLITEGVRWDNPDPFAEPTEVVVRRLWRPGAMQEWEFEVSDTNVFQKVISTRTVATDFADVPFTKVGGISEHPHFFDDVEDLQRAIMDLESSLDTLFHKVVFAQPVLPRSVADVPTGEVGSADTAKVVAAAVGYANAILEGQDEKGISRYIGPDGSSIGKIQEELERKVATLFDTVGLHLGFKAKFSRTKEAEGFDSLDPQAVLRNYSQQITEAETRAWQLTHQFDNEIPEIVPRYTDRFRITDIYEDLKALTLAAQMETPDTVKKLVLHGMVDAVLEITRMTMDPKDLKRIRDDIEKMTFDEAIALNAGDLAVITREGVNKQATDDGEGLRPSGAQV